MHRENYSGKEQLIEQFLNEEFPDNLYTLKDGGIKYPLPEDVVKSIMDCITENALELLENEVDDDDSEEEKAHLAELKESVNSFSLVSGYVSALKDGYKRHKLVMSSQLLEDLDGILVGYRNTVAELKLDDKLSSVEGKRPLPEKIFRKLAER